MIPVYPSQRKPNRTTRSPISHYANPVSISFMGDMESPERQRARLERKMNPPNKNDPAAYRPSKAGINVDIVWDNATCEGKLIKHDPSASLFKHAKRHVLLVDRILYIFKDSKRTARYVEFLQLTKDTNAFVTDRFRGTLYCIEIRKSDKQSWFLEADTAETMHKWLKCLKQTIYWLRGNTNGVPTLEELRQINTNTDTENQPLASDSGFFSARERRSSVASPYGNSSAGAAPNGLSVSPFLRRERYGSEGDIRNYTHSPPPSAQLRPVPLAASRYPAVLPPQLPPPTTLPPPPPTM